MGYWTVEVVTWNRLVRNSVGRRLNQTQEENENLVLCAPETKRPRVLLAEQLTMRYCLVEATAIGEVHQR